MLYTILKKLILMYRQFLFPCSTFRNNGFSLLAFIVIRSKFLVLDASTNQIEDAYTVSAPSPPRSSGVLFQGLVLSAASRAAAAAASSGDPAASVLCGPVGPSTLLEPLRHLLAGPTAATASKKPGGGGMTQQQDGETELCFSAICMARIRLGA
jgi:hypothetical protein